jgi:hypothetical protein
VQKSIQFQTTRITTFTVIDWLFVVKRQVKNISAVFMTRNCVNVTTDFLLTESSLDNWRGKEESPREDEVERNCGCPMSPMGWSGISQVICHYKWTTVPERQMSLWVNDSVSVTYVTMSKRQFFSHICHYKWTTVLQPFSVCALSTSIVLILLLCWLVAVLSFSIVLYCWWYLATSLSFTFQTNVITTPMRFVRIGSMVVNY